MKPVRQCPIFPGRPGPLVHPSSSPATKGRSPKECWTVGSIRPLIPICVESRAEAGIEQMIFSSTGPRQGPARGSFRQFFLRARGGDEGPRQVARQRSTSTRFPARRDRQLSPRSRSRSASAPPFWCARRHHLRRNVSLVPLPARRIDARQVPGPAWRKMVAPMERSAAMSFAVAPKSP